MKILQPPGWAQPRGYSNGVAARGTIVSVAGQVGWDGACRYQGPVCRIKMSSDLAVHAYFFR